LTSDPTICSRPQRTASCKSFILREIQVSTTRQGRNPPPGGCVRGRKRTGSGSVENGGACGWVSDHRASGAPDDSRARVKVKWGESFGPWPESSLDISLKLSDADVEEIRRRYATGDTTHRALAQQFHVVRSHIHQIVTDISRRTTLNPRADSSV